MLQERAFVTRDQLEVEGLGFNNPRSFMDKSELRQLAENIRTKGLLKNLLVWRHEDPERERLIVVDGKRRLSAIDMLIEEGYEGDLINHIPVAFFEGSLAEARIAALSATVQHSPLSAFDFAKEMFELTENLGMSQKDLAKEINKSQAWVSRTLTAFKKASPELLKAWKSADLPLDTVMDIANLPREAQADAIKEQVSIRESGGRKAAGEARAKAKSDTGQTARPSSKAITQLLVLGENKPVESPYVKGMMDGLKFANGLIGLGEFEDDWTRFLNER